jgi:hypothetical protein
VVALREEDNLAASREIAFIKSAFTFRSECLARERGRQNENR